MNKSFYTWIQKITMYLFEIIEVLFEFYPKCKIKVSYTIFSPILHAHNILYIKQINRKVQGGRCFVFSMCSTAIK